VSADRDGTDPAATTEEAGDRVWPGSSRALPSVAELEAMGMAMALYLPTLMEERPDPADPDGVPLLDASFPAPAHVLDGHGRVSTGVLATLVDNVGGMVNGLGALPDWIVTTNLTLRRPAAAPGAVVEPDGELELAARVLRRGRTSVVSEVQVTRQDGSAVATAWMTSAILTPEMGPPPVPRPLRRRAVPVIDEPPYRGGTQEFFALEVGDRPGEVRIDAPPRLRNPWGIVHGGALAVAADAAARHAVAHPTGIDADPDGLEVTDLVLHYLSPARVGPVVARAELVGDRGDDHLVRVEVRDHGADDRVVVLAIATVRPC
jgi:acyl-coenzyme A thioesterase PaaI-like protein